MMAPKSAAHDGMDGRSAKSAVKEMLYKILPDAIVKSMLTPWRAFYWRRTRTIDPRRNRAVARALVSSGMAIKLELGSSKRAGMEGWVASDINGGGDLQLDLTKPIPFPDGAVQRIYSSHVLEHFSYPHPMLDLLRECRRILRAGGELSIAVPNARIFIEGYVNAAGFERERFCVYDVGLSYKTGIDFVNFIAYMGGDHKHMFDEQNLVAVLAEAGFRGARLRDYDPEIDLPARRHESIYATCVK
jgi:predicted SAM-dependent methyltransferase